MVAEVPAVAAIAGGLDDDGIWTAVGWDGGALEDLLRGIADSAPRDQALPPAAARRRTLEE